MRKNGKGYYEMPDCGADMKKGEEHKDGGTEIIEFICSKCNNRTASVKIPYNELF